MYIYDSIAHIINIHGIAHALNLLNYLFKCRLLKKDIHKPAYLDS